MRRAARRNKPSRYVCGACGDAFQTAAELADHWSDVHYAEARP